ncbi:hypothetical protein BGW41_000325 [Actinomortierella wolfii]|nr:hypothetical protein BGW41_000325 [Actinomortierella wolfii]
MIGTAASNLNHLLIHYTDRPPTIMTSTTILDLLEKCPNLTSFQFVADSLVSVRRTRYYLEDRLARWRKMQQHQWPHTSSGQDERQHHGPYKLKKLSITFANMHQSRLPFIFTLLQLCPELQTLVVPDNPSSTLPTLEHILHYDLRQLTSLDLTYYGFSVPLDDASLARIVRAIHANQLRTFKTWGAYNYETFLSLAEHHSQSIRVIDMSGYRGYVSSKGVQRVLSTCPNLESFKTGAYDPRRGFLLAEDIVQSEWVCNNLQVLEVPIGGVCRFAPGEKCPQHPTETQPEVRCRAIQRGVYRQLGKLQWLRELDVHMFNNSTIEGPQLATLEWSLASGLDETRNLKHLESFIFHGTNNAIGIEELKWMKEHWTSLRSLLHFRKDQMEQSLWLVSNWREMVPFIDAIGLSLP